VKYLLDTNVALWWFTNSERSLNKAQRTLLERAEKRLEKLGLSVITLWEIAKLVEHKRITLKGSVDTLLESLEDHDLIQILPLTARLIIESTRLGTEFHKDPSDQLIVATARVHGLTLLTADERIIDSGCVNCI
jgi:PIN domain nuclease of toxin-antitoxin system